MVPPLQLPPSLEQLIDRYDASVFEIGRPSARVRLTGAGPEPLDVVLDGHTAKLVPCDGDRPDAILTASGLDSVGGTTLFRLVRTSAASELFHHLGRAGILTRVFSDHATWLRFGLPAGEQNWRRLQIAMADFRRKG